MSEQTDSWFSPSSPPPQWDPERADPNRYADPGVQQVQYIPPQTANYGVTYTEGGAAGTDHRSAATSVPIPGTESERYEGQFDAYYQTQYGTQYSQQDSAYYGSQQDTDYRAQPDDPYATAHANAPVVEKAVYRIAETPDSGWSAAPSRRRRWIGRLLLLCVLVMQALLSLRLSNTASPDEAVNLVVGRQEYDHLFHSTPVTTDLVGHVSGSARLYPVLAGAADKFGGLTGARLLSLLFALVGTALLYSLTRRMFNERAAACAAAVYAVLQSTVVVGWYASPDALALMLVAFAAWIIVYTDRAPLAAVLAAAPVAAVAAAVEHASAFALPTILLLAVHTAWPYKGPAKGILRGVVLGAGIGVLLLSAGVFARISDGTLSRGQGTEATWDVLGDSVRWSGLFVLLTCGGAIAWVRRERMNETVDINSVPGSPLRRAALGLTLCATAVLVPLLQAQLHTSAAMYRHIAFGLLLASPLAGLGVTRLVGAHFRHPQLGILVWVLMMAFGISQSGQRFDSWPDSGPLVDLVRPHVTAEGRYLTDLDGISQYYLPGHWTEAGAKRAADVKAGRYGVIVLDTATSDGTSAEETALTSAIRSGGHYRLIAQLPHRASGSSGTYRIYVKQ